MKKTIGIIALSAIMLTSCQTLMQTSRNVSTGSSINSVTLADLQVSDKRESHTISHVTDAMQSGGEENVKRIAEAKILEQANADVLVEPRYHVVKKRKFFGGSKITSITVSGRPANFTNFRAIEDSILFRPEKIYITERGKGYPAVYKKKNPVLGAVETAKNNAILDKKRYISLGLGFMTGFAEYMYYNEPQFAYDISYVKWAPISKNKRWQYGFEIGFASQGCYAECEKTIYFDGDDVDFGYLETVGSINYRYNEYDIRRMYEYVHNLYVVPFQFAYIHEIGKNFALGLHIGPSVALSYANSEGKWFDAGDHGYFWDLFNLGLKGGWQLRYKKFMFDCCVQTGHLPQWRFYLEDSSSRMAMTFNFSYAF